MNRRPQIDSTTPSTVAIASTPIASDPVDRYSMGREATAQGHNGVTEGTFPDADHVRVARRGRTVLVVLV